MNPGVQQAIDSISTWLQLIITVGAVVTLFITVSKADSIGCKNFRT